MSETTITATDFSVARAADDSPRIRLTFNEGAHAINVIVPLVFGQEIAQQIDDATVQSKPTPIGPDELRIGSAFRLSGCVVRSLPNQEKRLTLTVEMEDGARTIPIVLSSNEVRDLISDLSR